MITQSSLKEALDYDPNTGMFRWKVSAGSVKAGDVAGTYMDGYRHIQIDGRIYRAHRLAWLYVRGRWPEDGVDHKNGIRDDNRIDNLREATDVQNKQNTIKPRSHNTSGYLGVSMSKIHRPRARIRVDGKVHNLGYFDDPAEAHQAYVAAKRRLHEFGTL
jgi:hypothetical protein